MKKGIFLIVGVFLAVIVGAFLLVPRPKVNNKTEVGATPTPTAASESGSSRKGVKEIQVVASEFSFSPSSITVTKGETVSLTFRNTGKFAHNLTIQGLGVATKTIAGGESDSVEFTAAQAGTFAYYCSVDGHRGMGMEGSLEVK